MNTHEVKNQRAKAKRTSQIRIYKTYAIYNI